ncbi:TIR domain-containing protein [Clostridium gasigenes]|uniref:toll/interleukin-1 receptor domain-containing protein n=1 Tax=Clostridium gasigenes TaxID=94869 RepID=UPI0014382D6F|nr:toll/interleukin-1 receptor domain-containing protein [Clostridium gasigenes]NKF07953.1 TIR domain-containing protein [Clostridium gasigenes]QSW20670.1 TIR domain-containing protein [Clostridium gasigenes]
MSTITTLQSQIARIKNEIMSERKKNADEKTKESNALIKKSKAEVQISKTTSLSTISSKTREIQRATDDMIKSQKNQSTLNKKIISKEAELVKKESQLIKEQGYEEKKRQQAQLKREQEIERRHLNMLENIKAEANQAITSTQFAAIENKDYDVFISHAWEDKEDFVRPLAEALINENIKVWYDETSIKWGASIRQSIDNGLAHSRFGIVVISSTFLDKYWTNYEVDGLFQKEALNGSSILLPIWHKVTKNEVLSKSSTLAGRNALNTAMLSIDEIVEEVKSILET